MFHSRSEGSTLRRLAEAVRSPHPATERFDPDFPTAMKCSKCGKHAFGPRRYMREAMEEHWRSVCPARATKADQSNEALILYPKT